MVKKVMRGKILTMTILLTLFYACAKQVAPNGGDKDSSPPIVESVNPPNNSTNFEGKTITIDFDEYIQLSNPNSILVSPLMQTSPEYRLKRKSLIVEFKEELKPNTTYTLHFGDVIKDFNEGNILRGFEYAFSTGDKIDSLFITGKLTDAATGEPIKEMLIELYASDSDTVFSTTPPDYVTRTNSSGGFRLSHLRADNYQIVALDDKNNNYMYDLPEESIAFKKEMVNLTDSTTSHIELQFFQENAIVTQKVISSENPYFGYLEIIFAQPQDSLGIAILDSNAVKSDYLVYPTAQKDTVWIWYRDTTRTQLDIWLRGSNGFDDTLELTLSKEIETLRPFHYSASVKSKAQPFIDLNQPAYLLFPFPITSFEVGNFTMTEDSVALALDAKIAISDSDPRKLLLKHEWKPASVYELSVADSSIFSFFGRTNDTIIEVQMIAYEESHYGNLLVTVENWDSTKLYILQLWNKDKKRMVKELNLKQAQVTFMQLPPGKYDLKIIEDTNGDGKWTTGNYATRQQPEKIFRSEIAAEVKGNWDTEVTISVGIQEVNSQEDKEIEEIDER